MAIESFTLNSGAKIPAIAYGVGTAWFKNQPGDISRQLVDSVKDAIKSGYTHLDLAEVYNTTPEVGVALSESEYDRSKLWITDKVTSSFKDIPGAIEKTLKELGVDYLDLYLLHHPFITKEKNGISLQDAWKSLEEQQKLGKVKNIGISNFAVSNVEEILKIATIKPAVIQIEYNAYLQNQTPGIVQFAQKNDILVTAYSPLGPITKGSPGPLDPLLDELSKKYNRLPAQILLRWVYQNGILPITTSGKIERIKQTLEIFDFKIDDLDVEKITTVSKEKTLRLYWKEQYSQFDDDAQK